MNNFDHYPEVIRFKYAEPEEIKSAFTERGGLWSIKFDGTRQAKVTIAKHPDHWLLETRFNPETQRVELWVRASVKPLSDLENKWTKEWFVRLGFDELEAAVLFSSNVPNKRHIARDLAELFKFRKGLVIGTKIFKPTVLAAANQIQSTITELLLAAKASGRIN